MKRDPNNQHFTVKYKLVSDKISKPFGSFGFKKWRFVEVPLAPPKFHMINETALFHVLVSATLSHRYYSYSIQM